MNARRKAVRETLLSTAVTITLITGLQAYAGKAHAGTGPVVAGNGWKLQAPRITHIDTKPWVIAFHDLKSKNRLMPYVTNTAAELSSYLGVKFTVTPLIVPVTQGKCPPSHVISLRSMSKPDPAHPTRSFTGTCSSQGAAYSAYVFINSDYWQSWYPAAEYQRMNVIWHEMAHTVGLDHPATCPRDKYGKQPLMCANTYNDLRVRRYSSFEATAFSNLKANRAYYPPVP
ncbi:hypothetical protein [Streptomyces chartreusis]|uniref:hypothetical protein n=1 Tax=Streptomyces chartreusis TaxID=1969 RepID=UPI0037DD90A3|nr:hypothetical protein OG938_48495 [Streptomyces chartreusis]